jgi:hypothetical protein
MKNSITPDPAVDKSADEHRTPAENLKHAVKTTLPPGVNAQDLDDPGTSLGGPGGRNEAIESERQDKGLTIRNAEKTSTSGVQHRDAGDSSRADSNAGAGK